MYDRTVNGEVFLFGNTSALYESDMVMVDHQTGSYWMQVSGEVLVGTLVGEQLTALPSQTTTWALWQQQFPHSFVLSRDTGFDRNYSYDPFTGIGERLNQGGDFFFPVSENGRDPRLDAGEVVLGVEVNGQQIAYPNERLGDGVIHDQVGETAVVVFSQAAGPTGAAYAPIVDGQLLTFVWQDGRFQDEETGSTWALSGLATDGPLAGTQLTPFPTRSTFWFSLITSFPDLTVYTEE